VKGIVVLSVVVVLVVSLVPSPSQGSSSSTTYLPMVSQFAFTPTPSHYLWSWRPPPYVYAPWSAVTLYPVPIVASRSPFSTNTIFVGTVDDCFDIPCPPGMPPYGIYRSTDDGLSWQFLAGTNLPGGNIVKIAINPATPSLVLAGYTMGYTMENQYVFGLYLSRDGGTTWSAVLPQYQVTDIEYDPTDPTTVYVAAYGPPTGHSALYKSSDAGASWQLLATPTPGIVSLAVDPASPNVLLGVPPGSTTPPFIYRSTDSGVTWLPLSTPSGIWIPPTQLLISPANPNRIYAFGGDTNGIWRSDDLGQTWSDVTSNLPNVGFGRTVLSADIDPSDGTTIWVGQNYSGIFSSKNGGTSWTAQNDGIAGIGQSILGPMCNSIALVKDGKHAAVCNPYGFVYLREPD
jgi:photosystem II stability/assembly factor-like uncharacterized protein